MKHIVGTMAECGQESQGMKEYGDGRERPGKMSVVVS